MLEQSLQHTDRGVKRRPRRTVRCLTVPATIGQLLGEQPVDDGPDVLAEVGADRHDLPVDARLGLAFRSRCRRIPAGHIPATSPRRGRGSLPDVLARSQDPGSGPAAA